MPLTAFQEQVYTHLLLIPRGKLISYRLLSHLLSTSPRAIGQALRHNPYAPHVPCHRVISATGYIGGFMGEWERAPSGVNQVRKRGLLIAEGVLFDEKGGVLEKPEGGSVWWMAEGGKESKVCLWEVVGQKDLERGRKLLDDIVSSYETGLRGKDLDLDLDELEDNTMGVVRSQYFDQSLSMKV